MTEETRNQGCSTGNILPKEALHPRNGQAPPKGLYDARVTAVHRDLYTLAGEQGEFKARLKAGIYYGMGEEFPTVGDFVWMEDVGGGQALICKTLPRFSLFERPDPDPGKRVQAVAANFDTVFICVSCNQNFNLRRIERYVTASWQSGAVPVVVLTKSDLAENPESYASKAAEAAPGVQVLRTSAVTGEGKEQLLRYLTKGACAALLGSSGTGKSSLVNLLFGREQMAVGEIREDDARGRHTTTHRQLLCLPDGGLILDTPGMRSLGMWGVSEGLGDAFPEMEGLISQCRFSDCTHGNEPGCAVRKALEEGRLTEKRWQNYLKLKREARFTENKSAYLRERGQAPRKKAKGIREKKNQK